MNKWRYKVERVKFPMWSKEDTQIAIIQEKLTRLGMESWELVNMIDIRPLAGGVTLYLKRSY
jgi:hypothetical protein